MLFMSYDTESKSRNADFISIAAERQSATLGAKGPVKLKNPHTAGVSHEPSRRRRVQRRVQLPLENFPVFLYNKKKTGVTPLLIEKELL